MSNEKLFITEAQEKDLNDISRIFKDVISTGDTYVNRADTTDDEIRQKWFADNAKTFIAKLDGKIVGAYLIRPNHVDRGSHTANCSYIVDKSARGHGVGKTLGEHSIITAKQLNYRAIQFNFVVSTNKPAVKLWQSLGFDIIGTVPQGFNHMDLGYVDAYIMHRKV